MKKPLALPAISFRPTPDVAKLLEREVKQPWFLHRSHAINAALLRALGTDIRKNRRAAK